MQSSQRDLRITSQKITCLVTVDRFNRIVSGAPITRKWWGQSLSRLLIAWKVDGITVLRRDR